MKGFREFWAINKIAIRGSVKPFVSFLVAFSAVLILSPIVKPLIFVEALNAFEKGQITAIYKACFWASGIILGLFMVSYFLNVYGDSWITRIMNNGKFSVLRLYSEMSFYRTKKDRSYGAVQNTIESGISDNMVVWAKLTVIFSKVVSIVFLTAMGLEISGAFLVIALFLILLEFVIYSLSIKWVRFYSKQQETLKGVRNTYLNDMVLTVENSVLDDMYDWQLAEYRRVRMAMNDVLNASNRKLALYKGISDGLIIVTKLTTVLVVLNALDSRVISAGIISTVFLVIDALRDSIVQMRDDVVSLQTIFVPSVNLKNFLDAGVPALVYGTSDTHVIEADAISFSVDGTCIFENVSFGVKPHEKVAIIGENGTGKTTFVRCLLCLYEVENGGIRYNEAFVEHPHTLAYIPNDNQLFNLSVTENIEIATAEAEALTLEDIKAFETGAVAHLSDGEKKRVCISRGVNMPSRVLIADEPFEGLDAKNKERYMAFVWRHFDTVVMVTHAGEDLERFDKVYEMKDKGLVLVAG